MSKSQVFNSMSINKFAVLVYNLLEIRILQSFFFKQVYRSVQHILQREFQIKVVVCIVRNIDGIKIYNQIYVTSTIEFFTQNRAKCIKALYFVTYTKLMNTITILIKN